MKPAIIKKPKDNPKRSDIQSRYDKLISELETKQQFRLNLDDGLKKAYLKINELLPLQKETHSLSRDMVIRLDELSMELVIGKNNREWFTDYISKELDDLLDIFGYQDEILANLFEKYADLTIDDIAGDEETLEVAKSIKDAFGFDIDVKEFLEKGKETYFKEHQDRMHSNFDDFSEKLDETPFEEKKANQKKKNPKAAEEADQLAKDARNIYMRLIKKFHPDLEMDQSIRIQKTEVVKQVTRAYQENDFFALLKLQVTYLDENETDAAKVADDMLKRYNKILQKQLDELDSTIRESHYMNGAVITDFIDKNGKFSPQKFAARKREIEKVISSLKLELINSRKRPKGWFKEHLAMIKNMAYQNMMGDMFANMF